MSNSPIKVEVVCPWRGWGVATGEIFGASLNSAIGVLLVWWFFASWFPQLGFTYWQLILPVFTFRRLLTIANLQKIGRQLSKGDGS